MTAYNGWFVRKVCHRCGAPFSCAEEQAGWRATCLACAGKGER